jgi:FixJ family two-component response regulator
MAPMISVVDDDASVRESLQSLLRSVGLTVRVFAAAEEFLNSAHLSKTDCLILDVRMPGMSGIELYRDLVAKRCRVPVVFITAHGDDDDARSQALADGAVAYLIKPFSEEELIEAVGASLSLNSDGKTSE